MEHFLAVHQAVTVCVRSGRAGARAHLLIIPQAVAIAVPAVRIAANLPFEEV